MAAPTLVYCAGSNRRFDEIALTAGYVLGAQLPRTVYFPLWMADQDWKRPNRSRYMAALAEHRPTVATVLDWERDEQLPEVLDWAEEAAQHVERVMIVPKVVGRVGRIPRRIGGADVVLAYSVPTRFGGSSVPLWEMAGWPIHLLGGSPHVQMRCWQHLSPIADVVSADGNLAQKMATQWCQFWVNGSAGYANNRWWPTLTEADGTRWEQNGPYEAFRRSCANITAAWRLLSH
jgi:O-succinylbenzoate synthase